MGTRLTRYHGSIPSRKPACRRCRKRKATAACPRWRCDERPKRSRRANTIGTARSSLDHASRCAEYALPHFSRYTKYQYIETPNLKGKHAKANPARMMKEEAAVADKHLQGVDHLILLDEHGAHVCQPTDVLDTFGVGLVELLVPATEATRVGPLQHSRETQNNAQACLPGAAAVWAHPKRASTRSTSAFLSLSEVPPI